MCVCACVYVYVYVLTGMSVSDFSIVLKAQVLKSFQVKTLESRSEAGRALNTSPAFLGIFQFLWHTSMKNNEIPLITFFGYSGPFIYFCLCDIMYLFYIKSSQAAHLMCLLNVSLICL